MYTTQIDVFTMHIRDIQRMSILPLPNFRKIHSTTKSISSDINGAINRTQLTLLAIIWCQCHCLLTLLKNCEIQLKQLYATFVLAGNFPEWISPQALPQCRPKSSQVQCASGLWTWLCPVHYLYQGPCSKYSWQSTQLLGTDKCTVHRLSHY